MDRTDRGGAVFCGGAPIFLFARAENFRRDRRGLGDVFLRVRTLERRRQPSVHAGYSVAQSGDRGVLFFSAMDRRRPIQMAGVIGGSRFARIVDQVADGDCGRAAALSFCSGGRFHATRSAVTNRRDRNCSGVGSFGFLRRSYWCLRQSGTGTRIGSRKDFIRTTFSAAAGSGS